MSTWSKYPELEPVRRLRNEGRELIGQVVYVTEKRDGENVSLWFKEGSLTTSSHNQVEADESIQSRMKATPEYAKVKELLESEREYHKELIVFGELLKGSSPTRIEPKRKHLHWIMFDVYDLGSGKFYPYEYVYQLAYHFKIPVVRCIDKAVVASLEALLNEKIPEYLKWCRRHRREGVVGKCYDTQTFFKEKIDLPKLPRVSKADIPQRPQLPAMDEHTIRRALQHAYDEVAKNGFDWRDKSKAMPILVKQFQLEAAEHDFSTPRNMYQLYTDTPVDSLKAIQ